MAENKKQHYTRSVANSQEFKLLADDQQKMSHGSNSVNQDLLEFKQVEEAKAEQDSVTELQRQPMGMAEMMHQLLNKQDRLLEENKQLRQEMALQQSTISYLHETITTMRHSQMNDHNDQNEKSSPTSNSISAVDQGVKEQTTKQLQSKRIKQLLDSKAFSGSTSQEISDWIEDFEDKCDDLALEGAQRFSVAVGLLADNAKLWYDTQKDTIKDWETLKTKLSAYFKLITGTDQFELQQKLHNRRRRNDEPAIDYCHQTLKLCSKVDKNMDEMTRIKHLGKGLDTDTRLHMDLKNPNTTEEFLQALIKYEKWKGEKQQPQKGTFTNRRKSFFNRTPEQPAMTKQQEDGEIPNQQQQQQQQSQSQHNLTHYQRADSNKIQYNRKTYEGCWTCGDMDHYKAECPKNY
ncbi:unnamed protein product [Adineta ricciae]|uniref:CCHC-type domain-containing protein n=1 Tax=Adineta ricciae TaxID=249248 RepID=A0A815ET17_ADIRI|nr:unnamed protein product [Adineta ricciae]CAF1585107.1 unnamed protein product [Adineta ricciae]